MKYGMNIGLTLGSVQNAKFILTKTIKQHYFDKISNFIFFIQDDYYHKLKKNLINRMIISLDILGNSANLIDNFYVGYKEIY